VLELAMRVGVPDPLLHHLLDEPLELLAHAGYSSSRPESRR
jgi:hypothetical protein